MLILHVVGARPNFMKAAAVIRALDHKQGLRQVLVHTGQHYDRGMSEVFSGNWRCLSLTAISKSAPAAMPSKRLQ